MQATVAQYAPLRGIAKDKFDDKLCPPYTLEGRGEPARHAVQIKHAHPRSFGYWLKA